MIIMLALRVFLVIAVSCCCVTDVTAASTRTIYDQRQNGDTNVQIDLKDLRVVALLDSELLDDYTDYDYFYDYADFTIKPGNKPTTSSTIGITEKNNITEVTESLSLQNSTVPTPPDNANSSEFNTTSLSHDEVIPSVDPSNGIASSSTSDADINNDKSQSSEVDDGPGTTNASIAPKLVYSSRSQKRCKPGYRPNGDGRCRRASQWPGKWLSLLP